MLDVQRWMLDVDSFTGWTLKGLNIELSTLNEKIKGD